MDMEVGFITGFNIGIEYAEVEKSYIIVDLGIIRLLFSKRDE